MSDATLFVGFDLGNERHALCVTDANGSLLCQRMVANDLEALSLLEEVSGCCTPSQVRVAVEDEHNPLVDVLVDLGFCVFTLNPKQVDRFRDRETAAGAKDDRRDARVLASTVRTDFGCYRPVSPASDLAVRLKGINRAIEALNQDFRRTANRTRASVLRCYPALLKLCPGCDEAWFWGLVELVLAAGKPLTKPRIAKLLKSHRIRRVKADELYELLRAPHLQAPPVVWESCASQAIRLIETLRLQQRQLADLTKEQASLLDNATGTASAPSDVDILLSVPGVGPQTTAILIVEAIPTLLEPDGYQICRSLAGVAPVTKRSGRSTRVEMRRSCKGSLRQALHHATANAALRDEMFQAHYQRLRARGHSRPRALRALGDRLLKILSVMLKSRSLYQPPAARKTA